MYQDSAEQAAKYLREAIPLMVKYEVPPTPFNYAVWYTYVSKRNEKLVATMERTLKSHGTCPERISETLFREHVISEELSAINEYTDHVQELITGLEHRVTEAIEDSSSYEQALNGAQKMLAASANPESLLALVKQLSLDTHRTIQKNHEFHQRMISAQQEMENLKQQLKQAQQAAGFDELTGLYNRRYFQQFVKDLITAGDGDKYSLVMVDVDHFKSFNDTYGHLMGDKVLQGVGQVLKQAMQEGELAVRYGGEEFMLLLKRNQHSLQRTESLRARVETISLKDRRAGKSIRRITASFGMADYKQGATLSDWVNRADMALYSAKQDGRNRVAVASIPKLTA